MALSNAQKEMIFDLLQSKIDKKLREYNPETRNMPFHVRLLGQDRMAVFSFVQSVNKMLGSSIFEQVATLIAQPRFRQAAHQYRLLNASISDEAQKVIQSIIDNLLAGNREPDKEREINEIASVSQKGKIKKVKAQIIDLFLEDHEGGEYYFDLKTAKPNMGEIVGFKRRALECVAMRNAQSRIKNIYTGLAIPYNPYEPQPYARWTFKGLFEIDRELKVAGEFWDFLGGENTYGDLLGVFERVGVALRKDIDKRFEALARNR